jgi:replicative DNA helicase
MTQRTPPQNVEIEMAVLGAVMCEPQEGYPLARQYLKPESFYLNGHQTIFETMGELHARGIPPDSMAMLDALRGKDLLDKVGGSGVIMGMMNSVPTAASLEHHAKIVAEKYRQRQTIRVSTAIAQACYDNQPADQVLGEGIAAMLELMNQGGSNQEHWLAEVAMEYWEELGRRDTYLRERREAGEVDPKIYPGLPTGYYDLDYLTNGLKPEQLVILAARPSQGKTALCLNVLHHICGTLHKPALFISLEMGSDELAARIISMESKHTMSNGILACTPVRRMETAEITTSQEWRNLTGAYSRVLDSKLIISKRARTPEQLLALTRRCIAKHGIELVAVDYLQLMRTEPRIQNRVQEVSEISRSLKELASDNHIPVLALSQLKRPTDFNLEREPDLPDLRESGAIEQDADVVMFLHGKLEKTGNTMDLLKRIKLLVRKNRNGPLGDVTLAWYAEAMRFLNPDQTPK